MGALSCVVGVGSLAGLLSLRINAADDMEAHVKLALLDEGGANDVVDVRGASDLLERATSRSLMTTSKLKEPVCAARRSKSGLGPL